MLLMSQIEHAVELNKNMSSLEETLDANQTYGAITEIKKDGYIVHKKNVSTTDIDTNVMPVSENTINKDHTVEKYKEINGIVKTNGDTQNDNQLVSESKEISKENIEDGASTKNESNGSSSTLSESCDELINTHVDIGGTKSDNNTNNIEENATLLTEITVNKNTKDTDDVEQQTLRLSQNDKGLADEFSHPPTKSREEHNLQVDSSAVDNVSAQNLLKDSIDDKLEIRNKKLDISITDENMTRSVPAFSPHSDSDEKDINIAAQLKQLEDDVAMEEDIDISSKVRTTTENEYETSIETETKHHSQLNSANMKEDVDAFETTQENNDMEVMNKQEKNLVYSEIIHLQMSNDSNIPFEKEAMEEKQNDCEDIAKQLEVTTENTNDDTSVLKSNLPEKNSNEEKLNTENEELINSIIDKGNESSNLSENYSNYEGGEAVHEEPVENITDDGNEFTNLSEVDIAKQPAKNDVMEIDTDKSVTMEDNEEINHKPSAVNMVTAKSTDFETSIVENDQHGMKGDTKEASENANDQQSKNIEIKQRNGIVEVNNTDCISIQNDHETVSTTETLVPTAKDIEGTNNVTSAVEGITENSANRTSEVSTVEVLARHEPKENNNIVMEVDDPEVISIEDRSSSTIENKLRKENVEDIDSEIAINKAEVINIDKHVEESSTFKSVNSNVKNVDDRDITSVANEKPLAEVQVLDDEEVNVIDDKNKETKPSVTSEKKLENPQQENIPETTLPVICKLSNTMDILSDDEDDLTIESSEDKRTVEEENKFINIDDDDDIMIIEETNSQGSNNQTNDSKKQTDKTESETKTDSGEKEIGTHIIDGKTSPLVIEKDLSADEVVKTNNETEDKAKPDNESEGKENKTPIISKTFLKTVTKNLAEMTRNELEDFCILRLVESVVDKSNLNEIKNKMKTMAQTIEELRKKAISLTKQNRDLELVVKTVQKDQKMRGTAPMMPMKITRSVGMQVVLGGADKSSILKKKLTMPHQPPPATIPNRPVRNVQSPKTPKVATNNIPVPRLVPASSPTLKSPTIVNSAPKPTPPAARNTLPQRQPEKRPHSKLSPASSVTVDLTDDEPPAKVNTFAKSPAPPVRLVPSQNLMAQKNKPQFAPTGNSPRKVYIPISGPQGQQNAKPGVIKNFVTPSRPKAPPAVVRMQHTVRMNQATTHRHPAPLPDAMKQYQPPTWKSLPPAPDLKLSKVDNGIVISWKFEGYQPDQYEEVASFQLYAYQETPAPPSTALWKKIGDIKALPLPMACTLTQFMSGFKYYFAVRAIDVRSRIGPFSLPGSIMLISK